MAYLRSLVGMPSDPGARQFISFIQNGCEDDASSRVEAASSLTSEDCWAEFAEAERSWHRVPGI